MEIETPPDVSEFLTPPFRGGSLNCNLMNDRNVIDLQKAGDHICRVEGLLQRRKKEPLF